MSDAFWVGFFAMVGPSITVIVSHFMTRSSIKSEADKVKDDIADAKTSTETKLVEQDGKLDHITTLSNSVLSHTVEKKEEIEKKLEQAKVDELSEYKRKVIELEKQVALLTPVVVVPPTPVAPAASEPQQKPNKDNIREIS